MLDFKPVSADSHVNEHPDAWARVQREYGDRAPHIVKDPPGLGKGLFIIAENMRPMRSAYFALGHVVAKPEGHANIDVMHDHADFKRRVEEFNETYSYEGYPGGWNPEERLKEMDKDGVEAEVLFSSPTRFHYTQTDPKFQRAIFRSYNEWLLEMCSQAPKRLFAVPLISVLEPELAAQDIREYVKRGCKTVQIPTQILGSGYFESIYEPIWATAAECGIPISVHSNSSQNLGKHHVDEDRQREYNPTHYILKTSNYLAAVEFVSNLIFSGVFDRYPSLKVVCAEFKASSAASIVEHCDYQVGRESTYDPERNVFKRNPSAYMHDNVYWSFEDDRAWVLTTPVYGEDNFIWGNDYPHFGGTWPYSVQLLESQFQGIASQVQRKLARENIVKLYKLPLSL